MRLKLDRLEIFAMQNVIDTYFRVELVLAPSFL